MFIDLRDRYGLTQVVIGPPEAEQAEIDAAATVKPGGGKKLLTREQWLSKWTDFRNANPDFPRHRFGE